MGKFDRARDRSHNRTKPWLAWLLAVALLGSIYLFWIMPYRRTAQPVQVDFVKSNP